jgi:Peroxiredoxin
MERNKMLNPGDKAPYFELPDQDGNKVKLTDYAGKNLVLYFYPKDDTSGCTKEACSFRDNLPSFEGINAAVVGVSPDPVKSHRKFADKHSLNFTLLSDENKDMLTEYGVWKEMTRCGKQFMGVERTTYLIDDKGVIKQIFNKVKVDGHTAQFRKR